MLYEVITIIIWIIIRELIFSADRRCFMFKPIYEFLTSPLGLPIVAIMRKIKRNNFV